MKASTPARLPDADAMPAEDGACRLPRSASCAWTMLQLVAFGYAALVAHDVVFAAVSAINLAAVALAVLHLGSRLAIRRAATEGGGRPEATARRVVPPAATPPCARAVDESSCTPGHRRRRGDALPVDPVPPLTTPLRRRSDWRRQAPPWQAIGAGAPAAGGRSACVPRAEATACGAGLSAARRTV